MSRGQEQERGCRVAGEGGDPAFHRSPGRLRARGVALLLSRGLVLVLDFLAAKLIRRRTTRVARCAAGSRGTCQR